MPMRARQIWLRGPSVCSYASGGNSFSCVPQPISAVVVPSSRKPSTLQVLTNSSTCFGLLVICVSRSLQWITFTPSFIARWLNFCSSMSCRISSAALPLTFLSLMSAVADVNQALLGEMRDETGIGAVLQHRRRAGLGPLGGHAADVHVPPVQRHLLRRARSRRSRTGPTIRPTCSRRARRGRDTTGGFRNSQCSKPGQSAGRPLPDICPAARPCSRASRACATNFTPRFSHGVSTSRRSSKSMTVMFWQRHLEVLDQNGQRALRHRPVTDEQNLIFEFQHGNILPHSRRHATFLSKNFPRDKSLLKTWLFAGPV